MRLGTFVKMAWPSSSTESKRLPFGVRPRRAIFFRWANGRVYDLLLILCQLSFINAELVEEFLLYEVKDCNSVAHWRKETSSIWAKEQVSLTVNSPEEVRELCILARVLFVL